MSLEIAVSIQTNIISFKDLFPGEISNKFTNSFKLIVLDFLQALICDFNIFHTSKSDFIDLTLTST